MYVMDININNYLGNKNKRITAIHNNAIIFDGIDKYTRAHPKSCKHFLRTFKETFQAPYLIFKDHLPGKQFYKLYKTAHSQSIILTGLYLRLELFAPSSCYFIKQKPLYADNR